MKLLDNELKACLCGNTVILAEHDTSAGIHMCSIGCADVNCSNIVSAIGSSKKEAIQKAADRWNGCIEIKIEG